VIVLDERRRRSWEGGFIHWICFFSPIAFFFNSTGQDFTM